MTIREAAAEELRTYGITPAEIQVIFDSAITMDGFQRKEENRDEANQVLDMDQAELDPSTVAAVLQSTKALAVHHFTATNPLHPALRRLTAKSPYDVAPVQFRKVAAGLYVTRVVPWDSPQETAIAYVFYRLHPSNYIHYHRAVGSLTLVQAVTEAVRTMLAGEMTEHGLHWSSLDAYLAYHGEMPPFLRSPVTPEMIEVERQKLKNRPYEDLSYSQRVWLDTGDRIHVPEDPAPEAPDANRGISRPEADAGDGVLSGGAVPGDSGEEESP
jgi:hypothetical protein